MDQVTDILRAIRNLDQRLRTMERSSLGGGSMSGEIYTTAEKTKLAGIETGATADQSDVEIETAYNNQVAVATQAEAEAGTGTSVRRWTPQRVKQAVEELSSTLKPYFSAKLSQSGQSPPTDLIWNSEVVDNLGNFNPSNGIFTAPVDGFYVFGFGILLPNSPSGEFRVGFYKNNSIYNVPIWRKPNTGTWETIGGTCATPMSAGDTMRIKYTQGSGDIYTDSNHNNFWGFMV